ncbi:uncharacterized protein [Henckelia pumila]|uniref:uncharacterized protein n=1 Tax=Henckelia pumila TaxID=405737 RepID=UPI003C6DDA48
MDDTMSPVLPVPDNILQPLLVASDASTLNEALERLIDIAKTCDGRLDLASKCIILPVLQLCQALLTPSCQHLILLSLQLLRNLCAGEIKNQNLFIELNGVEILSTVVTFLRQAPASDMRARRVLLQIIGNVTLAGEYHQDVVWNRFFPLEFVEMARLQSRGTCEPLCMVICTCTEHDNSRFADLCTDEGLNIVIEIIRTGTLVGFTEFSLKCLLSRICVEEPRFSSIFYKLFPTDASESCGKNVSTVVHFGAEQAYLLSILSEILNERVVDIAVSAGLAICIFEILRKAVGVVDFSTRGTSSLPTGDAGIDVTGYSLTILRDICASSDPKVLINENKVDIVDMLVSSGLVDLLVAFLRDLEPPAMIQKAMMQNKAKAEAMSNSIRYCPYKGFRRDVVSIIGNCAYRRRRVQDKIRELDGILLLLQQSVTDEDNPFLREWGIWSIRNILEDNAENQEVVANMELQGSVNVPEVEDMGLRVEVDPTTRRAKLVNL